MRTQLTRVRARVHPSAPSPPARCEDERAWRHCSVLQHSTCPQQRCTARSHGSRALLRGALHGARHQGGGQNGSQAAWDVREGRKKEGCRYVRSKVVLHISAHVKIPSADISVLATRTAPTHSARARARARPGGRRSLPAVFGHGLGHRRGCPGHSRAARLVVPVQSPQSLGVYHRLMYHTEYHSTLERPSKGAYSCARDATGARLHCAH